MPSDPERLVRGAVDSLEDEALGSIVRALVTSDLPEFQDAARLLTVRLFQRNAIFAARVGSSNRITIPDAEVEKLDLPQGALVQVWMTPLDPAPEERRESE